MRAVWGKIWAIGFNLRIKMFSFSALGRAVRRDKKKILNLRVFDHITWSSTAKSLSRRSHLNAWTVGNRSHRWTALTASELMRKISGVTSLQTCTIDATLLEDSEPNVLFYYLVLEIPSFLIILVSNSSVSVNRLNSLPSLYRGPLFAPSVHRRFF